MTRLARFRYVGSKNPVAINPMYVIRVEAVTTHPTAKQTRIHLAGGKEIDVIGDLDETVTQLDNAMAGSPSAKFITRIGAKARSSRSRTAGR